MARTLTTYQQEALEAADRSTFVRVNIEDADANMIDVTQIQPDFGDPLDFLEGVIIRSDADRPISVAEIVLAREIDGLSLSPLMEGSELNEDAVGAYAPHINPARFVEVEVAVMKQGDMPSSGDYERIWEGYIDDPEFGGLGSRIRLTARDPIARLNDTIIETVTTYGGGSPLTQIDTVMQQILDDNMGSGEFPLWVDGTPSFGIEEYELGHVSVLEALQALADLQGWNLHWLWHESPGAFRLTYYEPDRSNTTADWTFGPDDYYDLPGLKLAQAGIRNAGEVLYRDSTGAEQSVSETRSTSVATYDRRFIRIDERGSRQIQSSAQASALLTAILDDTETPIGVQQMDAPFHWPIELGDVHDYASNGVHYDTTQTWGVFGYQHILTKNRIRTIVTASGKPSGGYQRWHERERRSRNSGVERGARPGGRLRPAPSTSVTFSVDGDAVVSAAYPDAEVIYVNVGDGTDPSFPTPDDYDGLISGAAGTVDTGIKVTTGNEAHVRVVARDSDGQYSAESVVRHARRLGPFHKITSDSSHTGDTIETTLATITVPAGRLGTDGIVRITIFYQLDDAGATETGTFRFKWGTAPVTIYTATLGPGTTYETADILIMNTGSTGSQKIVATQSQEAVPFNSLYRTTASEDTTAARSLVVTGQLSAGFVNVRVNVSIAEYLGSD